MWEIQGNQAVGTFDSDIGKDILERRLRELIDIDEMQFGFSKGNGTTYATFCGEGNAGNHLEK